MYFRAEDSAQGEIKAGPDVEQDLEEDEGTDEQMVDGKIVKLGKIKNDSDTGTELESGLRGGPGEGGVESYSGKGRESSDTEPDDRKFVRWSSSTEIGDFIRDAARGAEFAIEIEGSPSEIRVGVPSFNDRTHYLRVRLRKASKKLANYASIKKECDMLAHRSAQWLAMGGFGLMMSWWLGTYYFTFMTDYGWDTMEPITVRPAPCRP